MKINDSNSQYNNEENNAYINLFKKNYKNLFKTSRYDKPIGATLLFLPCTWGVVLGQPIFNPLQLVHLVSTLWFGSVVMRAAGCIVNDMWDKNIDIHVERTKERPLTSEQLNLKQASVLLSLNLTGGLLTLTQLNLYSIALSFSIVPLCVIYPLCKRFTNYPQVVLGFCFTWGSIVGYAAAGSTLSLSSSVIPAYLGGILWVLIYDTIYAHQDKNDDAKIGVKSTALAWGNQTKNVMKFLWVAQLGLFLISGNMADLCIYYYPCCLASHMYLLRLINDFKMDDRQTCWKFFVNNKNFGIQMFLSFLIGKLFVTLKENDENESDIK
ncbi:para-hydroxybenzoate, putative [Ichthyophthirius multifiliis]|uniref:4-hydroxybenzoate polyprenyltransferase, mitochondrial n=1 Tax=Ichthyophthirius multifiliis TaxID=5932 RepID=G0R650_ICHMU|nr:para-hydroxybenzoate, putative [Ichthyophthirius multifiliis]EGR27049.1 para-hydroxybenzoate, putative [Ichthyophthirius multifiliis]|eukprot:XP_004023933.1 para-hydroxybenzoate, putative [Ichthyophthirius multifiliis]